MRQIALLRAINVRGHPLVRMTDVCAAFEAAGCSNVRSYIQSGNVVFDAADSGASRRVVAALSELMGAPASVLFRTRAQLAAIVDGKPFQGYEADRTLKLYVAFLAAKPVATPDLPVIDAKEALELIAVERQEAYVVSRRKTSAMYGFPNNFVERVLGVVATSRNWNTVAKLRAFAEREAPGAS